VSATVAHQSALAMAGCAPSAHAEKPVSGFAAPATTCTTKSAPTSALAAPTPGSSRRWRHPATAAATMTIPPSAAT